MSLSIHLLWMQLKKNINAKKLENILYKLVYSFGEDGQSYLDGISSWWVNLHGHAHPYIGEKIKAQVDLLEHVISGIGKIIRALDVVRA